jgi:hypothetical protein
VGVVELDSAFEGYVEMEAISPAFSRVLRGGTFDEAAGAELQPMPHTLSAVPQGSHKRSDLHVKRSASYPRDRLDEIMIALGFYEVQTVRNRIYTLQLASVADARDAFTDICEWLEATGGADRATFEVVRRLHPKPASHKLPLYVPASAEHGGGEAEQRAGAT